MFFEDDALEALDLDDLDQEEWVSRVSPGELYFVNEYGNGTVIFDDLVRDEFRFDHVAGVARIDGSWKDTDWLPTLEDELLYMLRMLEGSTERWFSPAKLLEENVSEDAYAR